MSRLDLQPPTRSVADTTKPAGWRLNLEDITPARVSNNAAFLRGLKPGLSKPESEGAAKRMLELAVELQRPLNRAELEDCLRQAMEACATESVVELDPERVVEYDVEG